jgi:hypothetical protein
VSIFYLSFSLSVCGLGILEVSPTQGARHIRGSSQVGHSASHTPNLSIYDSIAAILPRARCSYHFA